MNKIVKNDIVQIIAGNNRGKKGKVLKVLPKKGRVVVEGVNFIKRHTKANPQGQRQGGILEKEAPVTLENVLVICDKCNKPTRIGTKVLEDRRKVRICRKCGEVIEIK